MRPFAYTLRLTGEAVSIDRGRFWAETRAERPAIGILAGPLGDIEAAGVLCRRNLELWEDGSIVQSGEIAFGPHNAMTFRARGMLGASPDARLRHGTAVLEVTGGRGRLAGARGYVTSNFLLSDTGELTDHHLGLLFLEQPE